MPAPPLAPERVALVRELRAAGMTREQVAAHAGVCVKTVEKYAPLPRVPVSRLRAAFEASEVSAAEVARQMDWWSGCFGDSSRVRRVLGITSDPGGGHRERVHAVTFARLAEAIGVTPAELGQ